MRTRENSLGLGFKKMAMLILVASFAVACGQNNTSGKSSNNNGWDFGGGGISGGSQNGRIEIRQQLNYNVGNGVFVGVTSEGDIAIIQNNQMRISICQRADFIQGQGSFSQASVGTSGYCSVNEINNLDVNLPGRYGTYRLAFRPIYFSGSQLCQGNYQGGYQNLPSNYAQILLNENPCRTQGGYNYPNTPY